MKILCTFPGRYGDLLWALPTVRAISEKFEGEPVDLQIAGEMAGLADLITRQNYIRWVLPDDRWSLTPPNEWMAPTCRTGLNLPDSPDYDEIFHLGYRGWPDRPLPEFIYLQAVFNYGALPPLDLATPWITVKIGGMPMSDIDRIAIGFSETHFELKFGLVQLFIRDRIPLICLYPVGSRWGPRGCDWREAARLIQRHPVFLGDCSGLHVLARALGKPVLLMEPMEARWNPIFYPYGMDGPEVTVIKGNDGRPTWDFDTVKDAIWEKLRTAAL